MNLYEVEIHVWPHSTSRGNTIDQQQAGTREQKFEVRGDSVLNALQVAEAICVGIKQNPLVWQTHIKSIIEKEYTTSNGRSVLARAITERGEAYIK